MAPSREEIWGRFGDPERREMGGMLESIVVSRIDALIGRAVLLPRQWSADAWHSVRLELEAVLLGMRQRGSGKALRRLYTSMWQSSAGIRIMDLLGVVMKAVAGAAVPSAPSQVTCALLR